MTVDKDYCISSFLMYRMIAKEGVSFSDKYPVYKADISFKRYGVANSMDLYDSLKKIMAGVTSEGDAALALSGGIDSAILASMMPPGSTAYTFKCVVPGVDTVDETKRAAHYAKKWGLEHIIIELQWDDIIKPLEKLMKNKGAPIHSIESQIYNACVVAKKDGFSKMIFGENADIIYGGMDGLLKKDWTIGEYIDRYSYVLPYKVLRNPLMITEPFLEYESEGYVDSFAFTNKYFRQEALGTYNNACNTAGIDFIGPYSQTELIEKLDVHRIRSGDSKYLVREVFKSIYSEDMPKKIPMPRPTDEWLKSWKGPTRPEFFDNCSTLLNGDQKWMLYSLECFLNMID